jgi:hypothetical protein
MLKVLDQRRFGQLYYLRLPTPALNTPYLTTPLWKTLTALTPYRTHVLIEVRERRGRCQRTRTRCIEPLLWIPAVAPSNQRKLGDSFLVRMEEGARQWSRGRIYSIARHWKLMLVRTVISQGSSNLKQCECEHLKSESQ